ncbi:MAG: tRNA pseudouridine(55) synthase TruB [Alphaproteobacteria bacterium]
MHGWLVLDKSLEISSAAAVGWARRLLGGVKAGHAGTLDPLASGVLPLALGEATKAMSLLVMQEKSYEFAVSWGEERATDDAEGVVTHRSDTLPLVHDIDAIVKEFTGNIMQIPPDFSAIQVQGKRAYANARAGKPTQLSARPVWVDSLELLEHHGHLSRFLVKCGKGVYVRSLARDMGRRLGCLGYVSALRRLSVGPFTAQAAVTLEKLQELSDIAVREQYILPIMGALGGIPACGVDEEQAQKLRLGQAIPYDGGASLGQDLLVTHLGTVVAIAVVAEGFLRARRVFVL